MRIVARCSWVERHQPLIDHLTFPVYHWPRWWGRFAACPSQVAAGVRIAPAAAAYESIALRCSEPRNPLQQRHSFNVNVRSVSPCNGLRGATYAWLRAWGEAGRNLLPLREADQDILPGRPFYRVGRIAWRLHGICISWCQGSVAGRGYDPRGFDEQRLLAMANIDWSEWAIVGAWALITVSAIYAFT
jgi:hypothetical protein